MKSVLKLVIPALLLLVFMTHCDIVSTNGDEQDTNPNIQQTQPENNPNGQSVNFDLEWSIISDAQAYQIHISKSETFDTIATDTTVANTSLIAKNLNPDTNYYWKVFPVNANNTGAWSDVKNFKTGNKSSDATTVMTLLSPVHNADKVSSILRFTWMELQNTTEYVYQISQNPTFNSIVLQANVTGTSYIPEGLNYRTKYHWRVKGVGEGNNWSDAWTFTTGTQANDEPIVLNVTLISPVHNADKVSTNLEFTWEELSGVSSYEYQYSDNSSFSSVLHTATVAGTSYSPGGLVHQKKYHWRVRVSGTGNVWSDVRTFTTGAQNNGDANTTITLITPVHNADKVSTNLEFTWQPVSGVSAYQYQYSDNSSFSSVLHTASVSGTSYTPDGLIHQKKYHWRVRVAGDGNQWSEVRTFTTGTQNDNGGTPSPVNLLTPQNNASEVSLDADFVWQEQSGTAEYLYQLSESSSFSSLTDEEIVWGTTYSPDGMTYSKTYFWRVKANETGSAWSNIYSFETKAAPGTNPPPPPPSSGSFVTTQNANFMQDGQVLRFAGTNAYYLPNYEKLNSGVVDNALDLFQDTGITVIRMWGFYDGYDCGYSQHDSSENVIQTAPGVYSESALKDLDRVIAKGKDRGISFIIPFINFWDELGGVCQYNTWAGATNPSTNMTFFLSNSQTQKWYKDYITMLLNRVNTVTGIAYKNEPAIFAWQIMNEGRNSGKDATIMRNWYQEIAQHIKSIDPNHLVSTGEEGFDEGTPTQYSIGEYSNTYVLRANEGTSYIANTSIPEIDFGSAHWYPGEFGFGHTVNSNLLNAQKAWLTDHKNIAGSVGKPFYIGEFGLAGWGNQAVHDMYNALYQHAENIQLDGSLLWQLVADGTKCWEFGGNICYPGGRTDTVLYNTFKQHVLYMKDQP